MGIGSRYHGGRSSQRTLNSSSTFNLFYFRRLWIRLAYNIEEVSELVDLTLLCKRNRTHSDEFTRFTKHEIKTATLATCRKEM